MLNSSSPGNSIKETSFHQTLSDIHDFWARKNIPVNISPSVMPSVEYQEYSTVFMGAMDHTHIYKTEIADQYLEKGVPYFVISETTGTQSYEATKIIPTQLQISNCIRLDGLKRSWESNRHLSTFSMLSISWVMHTKEAILLVWELFESLLKKWTSKSTLTLRFNKENTAVQDIVASELLHRPIYGGVQYIEDSQFSAEWTNRSGERIEFVVSFQDGNDTKISWEICNLVIVDRVGDLVLPMPIIEWWGALERIMAASSGIWDIFDSDYIRRYREFAVEVGGGNIASTRSKALIDKARTAVVMCLSWYDLWNKSRQEKAFRQVVREFWIETLRQERGMNEINRRQLLSHIFHSEKNLFKREDNHEDSLESIDQYINMLQEEYTSIYNGLQKALPYFSQNIAHLKIHAALLAYKFSNWSSVLVNIALEKLGIDVRLGIHGKEIAECDFLYKLFQMSKRGKWDLESQLRIYFELYGTKLEQEHFITYFSHHGALK